MIIEWLLGIGATVSNWFASLFPVWEPPEFLATFDDIVNDVLQNVGGIGVWADWVFILVVVGAVVSVWLIALGIKVIRAIAAHIPFFGGAG